MKVKKWLTINSRGSARLTKSKPATDWDEISIFLEINLPNALFTRPRLEAKIDIPEEAVGPDVLGASVIENVEDAIKQTTGLDFSINVIPSPVEKVDDNR